jgi:hypothetical protein
MDTGQKVLQGNVVEHARYRYRSRIRLFFRHAHGQNVLLGIRMYGTVSVLDYFCLGMPQGRQCCKVTLYRACSVFSILKSLCSMWLLCCRHAGLVT